MNQIKFEQLNEVLYSATLDNGLEVYVLPKHDFYKTYATFTTKYGSVDNHFVPIGQSEPIEVPCGIAHFLEHKMFESKGENVFQRFSKQGASVNAFTTFTRTTYLVSTFVNIKENLITLVDFVQDLYLTDYTVEKEKEIIKQEIKMYDEYPDWLVYIGTLENMYHNHPVKFGVTGTIESISKITKELLYECYKTFYHPSNMLLFIVGPVNPEEIIDLVINNQAKKAYQKFNGVRRIFPSEPPEVVRKQKTIRMPIKTPKCMIGFKNNNSKHKGIKLLKHELSVQILLEFLFGKNSENYDLLYDEGLINNNFSYRHTEEYGFGFSMIGGDTSKPDRLAQKLFDMTQKIKYNPPSKEVFDRIRNKMMGSYLRLLNSPEDIAKQFTRYKFNGINFFEVIDTLQSLSIDNLIEVSNQYFNEENFTFCQIVSNKD